MRVAALSMMLTLAYCGPRPALVRAQTVRHHPVAVQTDTADYDKAQEAIAKGDLTAARALLLQYTANNAGDYRGWYTLAYVDSRAGDKPTAMTAYRKTLALKPDMFEANLNLGLLLAQDGDKSAAIGLLQKATHETPNAADANAKKIALAAAWDALARLQSGDEAKHSFQQALALDPTNDDAQRRLAALETPTCATGEIRNADQRCVAATSLTTSQLEQMLAKQPSDAAIASHLAHAYIEQKEFAKAEPLVRQLLLKSPNDADENYRYAFLMMRLQKPQPAQQFLLKSIQIKPDLKEAYGDLAVVAAENKNYALSLKALDARSKYLPESAATYFLRATDLDHLRDTQQAVQYYHKFLESSHGESPDNEWQAKHRLIAIDPKERKR